jgi:cell division septal protein FtsQ
MEIKTGNKPKESAKARIVPPPDTRHSRKKATNKLGTGHIAGRRLLAALKTLGKLGAFVMMILFMLSVFVYAYTSDKFNVRSITFYGCKESKPRQLESIVRHNFPANILRINLNQLKNRLERVPWVKHVEIRRVLPSDLIIYVQERTPSAIIEFRNELMLADNEGIMLDRYDPTCRKLDVPVFRGVLGEDSESYRLYQEENSARIRQGLQMLSEIESGAPQETKQISEVDISDRENLKVMLVDDTVEVYLGEKDYLKRFHSLMENMNKYLELRNQYAEIESIDLRFPGNIIYRPRRRAGVEHNQKLRGT